MQLSNCPPALGPEKQRSVATVDQEMEKTIVSEEFSDGVGKIGLYTTSDAFVSQSSSDPLTEEQVKNLRRRTSCCKRRSHLGAGRSLGDLPLSKMPRKFLARSIWTKATSGVSLTVIMKVNMV